MREEISCSHVSYERVMSVPESVFSCIDSQSRPCGSPVWPTKDWSTWRFNLSRCHQLWTRGKEKGRVGGRFGWRKRAMTPTRMHTCTCAKTRIEHVCQSISQCPLERLNFCPFISPKTSQHSSLSPLAVLHVTLVQYNWEFVALGGRLVRMTCFKSRRDQLKCHFDIFHSD